MEGNAFKQRFIHDQEVRRFCDEVMAETWNLVLNQEMKSYNRIMWRLIKAERLIVNQNLTLPWEEACT